MKGLALAAATEETEEAVDGMEPILMELGENEDVEFVRLASWTLAYTYNRLHPNGERLGYVQRHSINPEYDMCLLFSELLKHGQPYAVVLYPTPPRVHWSKLEAEQLVDEIFPPDIRGEERLEWPNGPGRYRRGFVDYAPAGKRKNARLVSRITIGYRSDAFWNPLP